MVTVVSSRYQESPQSGSGLTIIVPPHGGLEMVSSKEQPGGGGGIVVGGGLGVLVGTAVGVLVAVAVGVAVGIFVGVEVGVLVGVLVATWSKLAVTVLLPFMTKDVGLVVPLTSPPQFTKANPGLGRAVRSTTVPEIQPPGQPTPGGGFVVTVPPNGGMDSMFIPKQLATELKTAVIVLSAFIVTAKGLVVPIIVPPSRHSLKVKPALAWATI
jgi:hypothetical protein